MSTPSQDAHTAAVTIVLEKLGGRSIKSIIEDKRADLVAKLGTQGISATYCRDIAEASLTKLEAILVERYSHSLPTWVLRTKCDVAWEKFTAAQVADTQALDGDNQLYKAICTSADEFLSDWEKDKRNAAQSWTKEADAVLKKSLDLQGAAVQPLAALDAARQEYTAVRGRIGPAVEAIRQNTALAALVPLYDRVAAIGPADTLLHALTENAAPFCDQIAKAIDVAKAVADIQNAINVANVVADIQNATKRFEGGRDAASKALEQLGKAIRGLAALIAARKELTAARDGIRSAVAAIRSNAVLAALVPFCDYIEKTTLGPADVLLQDLATDALLAPFLAQKKTGDIDGDALALRLGNARDSLVQKREALKPDEQCLGVLPTLFGNAKPKNFVAGVKDFIATYKTSACFVLAKLGEAQRTELLVLFCRDAFKRDLNLALLGKAQPSADDEAVCDAQLLEACFLAAFQACKGNPADKLSEPDFKKVKAAACARATAATEVNLEGVKVTARISIGPGNVQFPCEFEVPYQFHTDAACVKHVSKETQGNQSVQKLNEYFAEMVAACKLAKDIWVKNPAQPEVNVYKNATNKLTANWNILLKRVGTEIEIYHISSGYGDSGWVVKK